MTDDYMRGLALRYPTCWYDYNDNSTWFKDADLTIPALRPEDVRHVKNKVGPGYVSVERIRKDSQGRYYVEFNGSVRFHQHLLADTKLLPSDLEAIEQRFMRDMGILPKSDTAIST